jgi:hypothetical protein
MKKPIVFVTASQPGTKLTYTPEALARLCERIGLTPEQEVAFATIVGSDHGVVPVTAEEFIALAQGDAKRVLQLAKNEESNLHSLSND